MAQTRAWRIDFGSGHEAFVGGKAMVEFVLENIVSITPLPKIPAYAPGVMIWRNQIIPVIDMAKAIDPDGEFGAISGVMVLAYQGAPGEPLKHGGLVLRQTPQGIMVTSEMGVHPPADTGKWGPVSLGWLNMSGDVLPILNVARVFSGAVGDVVALDVPAQAEAIAEAPLTIPESVADAATMEPAAVDQVASFTATQEIDMEDISMPPAVEDSPEPIAPPVIPDYEPSADDIAARLAEAANSQSVDEDVIAPPEMEAAESGAFGETQEIQSAPVIPDYEPSADDIAARLAEAANSQSVDEDVIAPPEMEAAESGAFGETQEDIQGSPASDMIVPVDNMNGDDDLFDFASEPAVETDMPVFESDTEREGKIIFDEAALKEEVPTDVVHAKVDFGGDGSALMEPVDAGESVIDEVALNSDKQPSLFDKASAAWKVWQK